MRVVLSVSIALVGICWASAGHAGEECRPKRFASLDMAALPDGPYVIPVQIGGKTYRMALTLHEASVVYSDYAQVAGLEQKKIKSAAYFDPTGDRIENYTRLPELIVGGIKSTGLPVLVQAKPPKAPTDLIGALGTDYLEHFDVEVDFKTHKLGLFASDPCDGAGVYWSPSYATLPIKKDHGGQYVAPMRLDGHDINVMFNPSVRWSNMAYNVAYDTFGIAMPDPAPAPPGTTDLGGDAADKPSAPPKPPIPHVFGKLETEGFAISSPHIVLKGDPKAPMCDGKMHYLIYAEYRCYSGAQLELGLNDLEQLHLLFGFKANKLYVTSADVHP